MATASSILGKVLLSDARSAGLGLVLVQYEYEYPDRDGVPVSIKPNERYVLLAKTNDHWWQVRSDRNSKPFYIPAKYVKELPPDFPSPLDFADPLSPEPVSHPVAAPVPVPIPVPKTLEDPKPRSGDEVTIRVRPDASTGYRKTENRMSTFGVLMDFHDQSPPVSRHSGHPPGGPAETKTTTTSGTTNIADDEVNKKLLSVDSGKHRAPSFSPADPLSTLRTYTQPIPVGTPVVPASQSTDPADKLEFPIESEEEDVEEESSEDESSDKKGSPKEEESTNHIYESIQDLNLDLDALVGAKASSGALLEPEPASEPAPDPTVPPTQDPVSPDPNSPIYANVSSLRKTSIPRIPSPPPGHAPAAPVHATPAPDHAPSSTVSPTAMISPTTSVDPLDGWQKLTDHDSGKVFFFHPLTRQTTWSDPQGEGTPTPPPFSPASPQGFVGWEKLVDEVSGRVYYHNPISGATSWAVMDPHSPSSHSSPSSPTGPPPTRKHSDVPPPLPEEDYPTNITNDDAVFSTTPQQIPRARLDLKDGSSSKWKMQELPAVPQRLMGNGVSEEGKPRKVNNWRHSVAEDMFARNHRRNFSDFPEVSNSKVCFDIPQSHLLEKAGILNKTKVADSGKKIRKNWSQSWTVLHGGILTFHKDPKFAPAGNASKSSQIVPEYTVELRGASVCWANKEKSSKKNVIELKTRQGCEYLMQYDTESIITDWFKVILDTISQIQEPDNQSEEEDEAASDKEEKETKRGTTRSSSGSADHEQRRIRVKLRRFLQRRPTLQSVKEKGYIRDNVFGCHLDTLCHRENTKVPMFVEKCVRVVERRGLDVDGIYRVSGNLAVIQKLRHKADHEDHLDLDDGQWEEIHVVTGALKLFLRELPEPLFPFSCFDKFIAAIQVQDYSLKVSYMRDLVLSLPLPNHNTMELLFKHLRRVVEHKESNRMSIQSIAIVFGPTLLRPQVESASMTIHMVFQSQIVELMLNEFQTIFSQG